jgi:hypothetical protein
MSVLNQSSEAERITRWTKRIHALKDYVSAQTVLQINGRSFTVAEATAMFRASLDAIDEVSKKKAAFAQAVVLRKKTEKACLTFDRGLEMWAKTMFPPKSPAAAAFGAVRKETTPSIATKAAAVEKRRATRDARNTMGKKQRRKVKGVLPK